MQRAKLIILAAILFMSISSCGIFHKDCGCPKFGKVKVPANSPLGKNIS